MADDNDDADQEMAERSWRMLGAAEERRGQLRCALLWGILVPILLMLGMCTLIISGH